MIKSKRQTNLTLLNGKKLGTVEYPQRAPGQCESLRRPFPIVVFQASFEVWMDRRRQFLNASQATQEQQYQSINQSINQVYYYMATTNTGL